VAERMDAISTAFTQATGSDHCLLHRQMGPTRFALLKRLLSVRPSSLRSLTFRRGLRRNPCETTSEVYQAWLEEGQCPHLEELRVNRMPFLTSMMKGFAKRHGATLRKIRFANLNVCDGGDETSIEDVILDSLVRTMKN
jgi:hypothetical protein